MWMIYIFIIYCVQAISNIKNKHNQLYIYKAEQYFIYARFPSRIFQSTSTIFRGVLCDKEKWYWVITY